MLYLELCKLPQTVRKRVVGGTYSDSTYPVEAFLCKGVASFMLLPLKSSWLWEFA